MMIDVRDRDTLRKRASFDMRCPVAAIHVTDIDASTAGVDGCGQRETYVYNPTAQTWVLNSPGTGRSPPPFDTPPPPPPPTSGRPPGVPPGSPPGTLPGAPPGSPPGTPPGSPPMGPHHG
jgi:hypothetical protein